MRRAADRPLERPLAAAVALAALAALLPLPLAAQDLVSFLKPLPRSAPVVGSLVSVGGDVVLSSHVSGDLIVLAGDAELAPGARVGGNVLVIGGRLHATSGSVRDLVGGEVHTVEALEAAFFSEIETSPAAGARAAGLLVSLRLALLAVWLVIGSLLLFFAPRSVGAAAGTLPGSALLHVLLGGLAVLSGALLSAFLLAVLPARPALAVTALLLLLLLSAKAFGLVVVSLHIGRRLAAGARRGAPHWGDPAALALGLAALGIASLVPVAGRIVWMAASLVAIGAALGTGFGRLGDLPENLTLSARRA